MGRIAKNYIYNLLFQVITLLIPLVLSPYLARTLGSERLGVYSYVTSAANIIVTIGLLGTYNYGSRQVAYTRDNVSKCAESYLEIFSLRLCLGIGISIIYIILTIIERDYILYFLLYYSWVMSMIIDPSWLFVGQEDMKLTVIKNTCIKIACFVLILATVKDNEYGLILYFLIMGCSALVGNIILIFQTKRYCIKYRFVSSHFKEHISSSLALFWPQVASLFYLQVDKMMLKFLSENISEVSFYDYGEKIVTIPLTFITVLSTVMMPRIANEFAKDNSDEVRRLLNKAGSFSLMLAIPMMFGVALCASNLIPWYLGTEYNTTISVIICISPIILTNSLAGISGNQYLVATNQLNLLLRAYVSAAVINIIINALLIPRYGCVGAGIATSISATVSVVVQYYYMHKQVGVKSFLKYGIRYFLISIPMIVAVLLSGINRSATPLTTLMQVTCGVLVYGLMLIITRDENLSMILNKIKRK